MGIKLEISEAKYNHKLKTYKPGKILHTYNGKYIRKKGHIEFISNPDEPIELKEGERYFFNWYGIENYKPFKDEIIISSLKINKEV